MGMFVWATRDTLYRTASEIVEANFRRRIIGGEHSQQALLVWLERAHRRVLLCEVGHSRLHRGIR
jgi:hypothetical protein